MAGEMRAAVYAAVGAVRRRQVRLEGLDGRARRACPVACHPATVSHHVTHECLLLINKTRQRRARPAVLSLHY